MPKAAPLKSCEFLGYRLNQRAKLAWTDKAHHRFKERIREITSRNRGHKVQTVIDELNLYTRGWLNYYVSVVPSALHRHLLRRLHKSHSLQNYETYEVRLPCEPLSRCGL